MFGSDLSLLLAASCQLKQDVDGEALKPSSPRQLILTTNILLATLQYLTHSLTHPTDTHLSPGLISHKTHHASPDICRQGRRRRPG